MTDERIISTLDLTHPSGLGKGGFKYKLNHVGGLIYDDEEKMIMSEFEAKYVNPIGPFKKWVEIDAVIKTERYRYWLYFKDEFWESLSPDRVAQKYISRYLTILRRFSNDGITVSDIVLLGRNNYSANKEEMEPDTSSFFSGWIEQIKRYNPGIY